MPHSFIPFTLSQHLLWAKCCKVKGIMRTSPLLNMAFPWNRWADCLQGGDVRGLLKCISSSGDKFVKLTKRWKGIEYHIPSYEQSRIWVRIGEWEAKLETWWWLRERLRGKEKKQLCSLSTWIIIQRLQSPGRSGGAWRSVFLRGSQMTWMLSIRELTWKARVCAHSHQIFLCLGILCKKGQRRIQLQLFVPFLASTFKNEIFYAQTWIIFK